MKSKLLAGILLLWCLVATSQVNAQIVDDSTRVLFSPKTTLQLFENDVLEGRYLQQRIDTSINNMHNERFWYHDTAYFQHLGNIGTAAKPILFRVPHKIGARLGRNAFNRYAYQPDQINYYDTRSPYSHLYYIQGGRGEQVFEATHARNISPNWNIGVAYQIVTGNRQIGASTLRRDGYLSNQAVKAFTHYRSENGKYDLFANFTHLNQEQIEFGGIIVSPGASSEELFRYETSETNLTQAASQEFRNNYHLLHIYKLADENLKLYHKFDWGRQRNIYQDDDIARTGEVPSTPIYYPESIFGINLTDDRSNYREMQNEAGLTGNNKLSFYKAYIKQRSSRLDYSVLTQDTAAGTTSTYSEGSGINQLFVGGELRLTYGKALLSVDGEFQMTRDYKVGATARLGRLQASLVRVLRSPSLLEQRILSNHYRWGDNFNNSVTDRLEVTYAGKLGEKQFVRLTGHYNHIKRHIYFNTDALPVQYDQNQNLFGAELQHHIRFGSIHFENFIAYTNTNDAPVIRAPEWLVDSKLYFQGPIFRNALVGQFGVQAYLTSAYFADAYMPVTQQFHLQNAIMIDSYPVAEVFVAADIKSLNVFLKMAHVNQGFPDQGYFMTPYYPGMQRSFVFGIKWMFFD